MLSSEAGGMLTGRRTRLFTIRIFSARKNKRMSFTRTIALSVRSPTLCRRPGDELEAGKETRARLETHAGTEYPAEYQVRQNGWDRVAFSCFHGKKIISCSRWIQQFIFEPAANEWNARCTYADKIDAPSFPKNEPRPSSGSRLKKPAPPGCGKIGTLPWGALLPEMRLVVCMAISRPFRFDGNTAGLFKV